MSIFETEEYKLWSGENLLFPLENDEQKFLHLNKSKHYIFNNCTFRLGPVNSLSESIDGYNVAIICSDAVDSVFLSNCLFLIDDKGTAGKLNTTKNDGKVLIEFVGIISRSKRLVISNCDFAHVDLRAKHLDWDTSIIGVWQSKGELLRMISCNFSGVHRPLCSAATNIEIVNCRIDEHELDEIPDQGSYRVFSGPRYNYIKH